MSHRRQSWPQRVWANSTAKGSIKETLLVFAEFADKTGFTSPSPYLVAAIIRKKPRHVKRNIIRLIQLNEMKLIRRGGGKGRSSIYKITLPEDSFWEIKPAKKDKPKGVIHSTLSEPKGCHPETTLSNGQHPEVPTLSKGDTFARVCNNNVQFPIPPGDQPGPNEISPFSEDAEP